VSDTLDQIAQKVDRLLDVVKNLKSENAALTADNRKLKTELSGLDKKRQSVSLKAADQSDAVRTKLQTVLNRLEELEKLTG
jgi:regulator of replication initiation timing